MEINGIVAFSITHRTEVIMELIGDTNLKQALPFFYGTVLTVLLHMHSKFPIHASAVLAKNGLHLFCAKSGTGKSTLAMNLSQRGYPLFSDDKCVLNWDKVLKKYTSIPSIRAVRLWQDAIDTLHNQNHLNEGIPVLAKTNKFQFNLNDLMYDRPHLINRMYVIRKVEGLQQTSIRLLKGQDKVKCIQNQLHRPKLIVGTDIHNRYLRFIKNVTKLVPIFFVKRPANIPIHDFVNQIQKHIDTVIIKSRKA